MRREPGETPADPAGQRRRLVPEARDHRRTVIGTELTVVDKEPGLARRRGRGASPGGRSRGRHGRWSRRGGRSRGRHGGRSRRGGWSRGRGRNRRGRENSRRRGSRLDAVGRPGASRLDVNRWLGVGRPRVSRPRVSRPRRTVGCLGASRRGRLRWASRPGRRRQRASGRAAVAVPAGEHGVFTCRGRPPDGRRARLGRSSRHRGCLGHKPLLLHVGPLKANASVSRPPPATPANARGSHKGHTAGVIAARNAASGITTNQERHGRGRRGRGRRADEEQAPTLRLP